MTVDVKFERRELNRVLNEIKRKDVRMNSSKLGIEVFGAQHRIHSAMRAEVNSTYIKEIRVSLEEYLKTLRDYSNVSEEELSRRIKNLTENKNYSMGYISKMMGFADTYVNVAINRVSKSMLLSIYEFVSALPKSKKVTNSYNKVSHNTINSHNTITNNVITQPKEVKQTPATNSDRIIAKIGKSYLSEMQSLSNDKLSFQTSPDMLDALAITEKFLKDYRQKLESDLGFTFVKLTRVVTYAEEAY